MVDEVAQLLDHARRLGNFLATRDQLAKEPVPGETDASKDTARRQRPGDPIGPYKLLQEIGKGGMETSWMAEQHEPVRRQVALKLIKTGMELFLPVCHAVQHAHHKGIIHRDIKPSNVLVAEYDGRPVAKVIDFGVAKAVHQALTEKTMFTGLGQILGTLEIRMARLGPDHPRTLTNISGLAFIYYQQGAQPAVGIIVWRYSSDENSALLISPPTWFSFPSLEPTFPIGLNDTGWIVLTVNSQAHTLVAKRLNGSDISFPRFTTKKDQVDEIHEVQAINNATAQHGVDCGTRRGSVPGWNPNQLDIWAAEEAYDLPLHGQPRRATLNQWSQFVADAPR